MVSFRGERNGCVSFLRECSVAKSLGLTTKLIIINCNCLKAGKAVLLQDRNKLQYHDVLKKMQKIIFDTAELPCITNVHLLPLPAI